VADDGNVVEMGEDIDVGSGLETGRRGKASTIRRGGGVNRMTSASFGLSFQGFQGNHEEQELQDDAELINLGRLGEDVRVGRRGKASTVRRGSGTFLSSTASFNLFGTFQGNHEEYTGELGESLSPHSRDGTHASTHGGAGWFGEANAAPDPDVGESGAITKGEKKETQKNISPGMTISLRSQGGQFCPIQQGCSSGTIFEFAVVDAGDELVALEAGGCFEGGTQVPCIRSHLEKAAATVSIPRLQVISLANGNVALRDQATGKYFSEHVGHWASTISASEKFTVKCHRGCFSKGWAFLAVVLGLLHEDGLDHLPITLKSAKTNRKGHAVHVVSSRDTPKFRSHKSGSSNEASVKVEKRLSKNAATDARDTAKAAKKAWAVLKREKAKASLSKGKRSSKKAMKKVKSAKKAAQTATAIARKAAVVAKAIDAAAQRDQTKVDTQVASGVAAAYRKSKVTLANPHGGFAKGTKEVAAKHRVKKGWKTMATKMGCF